MGPFKDAENKIRINWTSSEMIEHVSNNIQQGNASYPQYKEDRKTAEIPRYFKNTIQSNLLLGTRYLGINSESFIENQESIAESFIENQEPIAESFIENQELIAESFIENQ